MAIFRHTLSPKEIEIAKLYLSDMKLDDILDKLYPERKTKHEGKYHFEERMRKIRWTLGFPYKRSFCQAQREQLLKNLEVYLEFEERHKEVEKVYEQLMEKEREEFAKSDFKDLSELC